jgi:hypothetical protein
MGSRNAFFLQSRPRIDSRYITQAPNWQTDFRLDGIPAATTHSNCNRHRHSSERNSSCYSRAGISTEVCPQYCQFNSLFIADTSACSEGNCRKQWKKITNQRMNDVRVVDPEKRAERKRHAEQAFVVYEERRTHAESIARYSTNRPNSTIRTSTYKFSERFRDAFPNIGSAPKLAKTELPRHNSRFGAFPPPISPVPELSPAASTQGYTPGESVISSATPAPTNEAYTSIASDRARESLSSRKRPAPTDCDLNQSSGERRISSCRSIASPGLEPEWVQPHIANKLSQTGNPQLQTPALDKVASLSPEAIRLAKEKTIADEHARVEDDSKYPRGFLHFVKFGLTITRQSVASVLSSSGARRSRWSFRQSPRQSIIEASNTFENSDCLCPQVERPNQPILDIPQTLSGRNSTNLFQELRTAGEDAEIAAAVKRLIKDGAPVNARDAHGKMPLHIALEYGYPAVCKVLLKCGADVHQKAADGTDLSIYGKTFQNLQNDVSKYAAIKQCRNLILEHASRSHQGGSVSGTTERHAESFLHPEVDPQIQNNIQYGRADGCQSQALPQQSDSVAQGDMLLSNGKQPVSATQVETFESIQNESDANPIEGDRSTEMATPFMSEMLECGMGPGYYSTNIPQLTNIVKEPVQYPHSESPIIFRTQSTVPAPTTLVGHYVQFPTGQIALLYPLPVNPVAEPGSQLVHRMPPPSLRMIPPIFEEHPSSMMNSRVPVLGPVIDMIPGIRYFEMDSAGSINHPASLPPSNFGPGTAPVPARSSIFAHEPRPEYPAIPALSNGEPSELQSVLAQTWSQDSSEIKFTEAERMEFQRIENLEKYNEHVMNNDMENLPGWDWIRNESN